MINTVQGFLPATYKYFRESGCKAGKTVKGERLAH